MVRVVVGDVYRALGADSAVAGRLAAFEADLLRWGRALNLISRREPGQEVRRLIAEGFLVWQWLSCVEGVGGSWADVGSGAGFPGLVFACAEPDQAIDLVERRQGRCDFLRRELRALGLSGARVLEADAASLPGSTYSLVSLKAVAPPSQALGLAAPLLQDGGCALLFQRPAWGGSEGWIERGRWVGPAEPVDLSDRAAILLQKQVPRETPPG